MRRRSFLRLTALAPLAALGSRVAVSQPRKADNHTMPDGRPHRFELSKREFLLDGRAFRIHSGEMHPIRIPAEYWPHRIRMARAMGLNTISLYLMWNALESEPGAFDLTTGRRDFAGFIRLCQREGMWVYLRPGPYICGEWDYGGLPPYLLRDPHIRVRDKDDARYMNAVRRYVAAVAPAIAPLMASRGGPILMVQIENEYASFGRDLAYLEQIRSLWQQHGVRGPFSISDGFQPIRRSRTYLPGTALGLDGDQDFAAAQPIAGEMPVWMGEGYPGWLSHWGDRTFAQRDFTATLRKLLNEGRSFNLYVVHGGTNFGFGAGANASDDDSHFQPVITSYDYGAPIDERGQATPDYHRFRAMLATVRAHPLPAMPPPPPTLDFEPFTPHAHASLWDNLPPARKLLRPVANELAFGQDHGMVLYRRRVHGGGELVVDGVRDYATLFHDGRYVDYLSRVRHASLRPGNRVTLPAGSGDADPLLEILVDSFGHVGYGHAMADRKGILGDIRFDGRTLEDWEVVGIPLDPAWLRTLRPLDAAPSRPPVFFRATLRLPRTGDCYLAMNRWNKGYVWVNGHLLGRYWSLGPQQHLFCPAPWLHVGDNRILVFDMHRTKPEPIHAAASLHG
jgi:beta-galactosidase